MKFKLEKDGKTIELSSVFHKDAYVRSGWNLVDNYIPKPKPVAEETTGVEKKTVVRRTTAKKEGT